MDFCLKFKRRARGGRKITENERSVRRAKRLRWEAALVGVVALAAALVAAERTPLTWDEGDAFVRAERVGAWFRALVAGPSGLEKTLETGSSPELDGAVSVNQANSANSANSEGGGKDAELADCAKENDGRPALKFAQNSCFNKKSGTRRSLGDVERTALEYFARCDGRSALFSQEALAVGWPHTIYREGHPAGYSLLTAAGQAFSGRFLPFLSEKTTFRFGATALFAAALAAVFYRVGRNWGNFAAILAVVGIVTIPRAFGHALVAGGDSLLISSWLLAWAFFDAALATKRGAICWGLAVGASFCAKFSGFAVVAPFVLTFLAAIVVGRRRKMGGKRGIEKIEKNATAVKDAQDSENTDFAAFGRLTLGLVVATAVFFAANPPLWERPFAGFSTFVSLNLRRDGFDIPIYFLGKIYSPSRPLPWWNGFFWPATTIPTALLAFAALGAATALPKRRELGGVFPRFFPFSINGGKIARNDKTTPGAANDKMRNKKYGVEIKMKKRCEIDADEAARKRRFAVATALALGATLPIIRAIPGTPTHDGARLLIASFPFWGILAAAGATAFVEICGRAGENWAKRRRNAVAIGENSEIGEFSETGGTAKAFKLGAAGVVAAAFGLGVVDLTRSAPQYLSFYNAALGGVVGATRLGMEPTYYWDAFDADAVAWLNAKIGDARADGRPTGVLFGSFSSQTLDYYRRWGTIATSETATISAPGAFANRGRFGFYVVQRRPTGLTALDFALFKTSRPLYRKTLRNPLENPLGVGGEVAALEIYDFRDVERVMTDAAARKAE